MYKIEYLPTAMQDILDIVNYINKVLLNPESAKNVIDKIIANIDNLSVFPYSNKAYMPKVTRVDSRHLKNPLKYEYRRLLIANYLAFYWVDEDKKTVVIARIIYSKRDYGNMI